MSDFIAELEPSFYRDCKYRDLAELSIHNYRRVFKVYRDWLSANGYPIDYTCLEADRYVEWSEYLKENRAPSTANLYLVLVRAFVAWAHAEGEVDSTLPTITVSPGPRKPQVIEDDTLSKLLKAAKHHKRHLAIRAELLVRLLVDTGVRREELVGIKLDDIDMDDLSINVTGKGSKTRLVYFGNNTARALDRYMRIRGHFPGSATPWLLLGQQGRLRANGVQLAMINAERRRNMPGRVQETRTVKYGADQIDAEQGGLFLEYAYAQLLDELGRPYEWAAYSEDPNEYRQPDFYHDERWVEIKRVNDQHNLTHWVDEKVKKAHYTVSGYIPFNWDKDSQRFVWDTDNIEFYGYHKLVDGNLEFAHPMSYVMGVNV